jgi:site-specific DNA-methyltransferase (adenine-specific)
MRNNNDNSTTFAATLHLGDCVEKLKLITDASISLIMFDPPYATTALKWDKHLDYKLVIAEFERVLTEFGTVVAFGSDQFTFHLHNAFATHATTIKYRHSAVWMKNRATNFLHAVNRPLKQHEDIMVFSRGMMGHAGTGPGKTQKRMTYNPQGLVALAEPVESRNGSDDNRYLGKDRASVPKKKETRRGDTYLRGREQSDGSVILWGKPRVQTHTHYPTTIYEYDRETSRDDPHRHPTKKPVGLYKELIATYSNPGETALDPTMGSGTAGAACRELGDRSFVGIERDPAYFAVCEERVFGARKAVA